MPFAIFKYLSALVIIFLNERVSKFFGVQFF